MLKKKSFLAGLSLTVLLVWLLFVTPFAQYQLDLNRLRILDSCLKDRQIPCRWVPGLENFYGSPFFNYYPPLSYYFGELILLASDNLAFSVIVMFSISLVGSYFFMYLFTSKFLGSFSASFSAFLYALTLFLAIVIFQKEIGLVWGLMFVPLVLFSLSLSPQKRKIRYFLFFSISLSLLILSTGFASSVAGLIFLWIFFRYIQIKSFAFLLKGIFSIVFAYLLSSFYVFPAVLENNLVYSAGNYQSRYLPKAAAEKPKTFVNLPYQVLTGDSDIFNFKQGTNWLEFETNTRTHTIVRLSQFYFPFWKIFIDGKETQVEYRNNSLGLMTIILGEGKHTVKGKLFDTPIRLVANAITVVSVILAVCLWAVQLKRVRYWLDYYKKRVN